MNGPYKIGTLARLTGFSPALLRAWERRFGLMAPARGAGRQRVYGDDDLAVLRRVRALVDQGRPIGEIARIDRGRLLAEEDAMTEAVSPAAAAHELRQRVVDAAVGMNARALAAALDEAFAGLAAERAVADVIEPAAVAIGDLWKAGRCSVASEHLASDQFLHRLSRLLDAAQPPGPDAPSVVAACFPGEDHQLGLRIVAWHLARHGVRVVYLGAAVPADDLARATRKLHPQAVLLSVTRHSVFARHYRSVTKVFPGASADLLFIGGQGVPARARGSDRRIVFIPDTPLRAMIQRIVGSIGRGTQRLR